MRTGPAPSAGGGVAGRHGGHGAAAGAGAAARERRRGGPLERGPPRRGNGRNRHGFSVRVSSVARFTAAAENGHSYSSPFAHASVWST